MEFKVGDKVVLARGKKNRMFANDWDLAIGKIYKVESFYSDYRGRSPTVFNDNGIEMVLFEEDCKPTKIIN